MGYPWLMLWLVSDSHIQIMDPGRCVILVRIGFILKDLNNGEMRRLLGLCYIWPLLVLDFFISLLSIGSHTTDPSLVKDH